jgi:hypothetical protein
MSNLETPQETEKKVSYTKLSTYLDCPELYRLRYIKKEKGEGMTLQEPLIKGVLAHLCIENYLRGLDKDDAIDLSLRTWLLSACNLEGSDTDKYEKECGARGQKENKQVSIYDPIDLDNLFDDNVSSASNIINIDELYEYGTVCGRLLQRCSESYNKVDKIRNKDGSVPKNPLEYSPTEFKAEYEAKQLHLKKLEIDTRAAKQNRAFTRMSLANIVAEAISFVYIFEVPDIVKSVEKIEHKLNETKVWFGEKKDIYWNGVIDTEYLTHEGSTIINDHKSEKYKRRGEDVAFDLQLNSYAAVRCEQENKLADYISITNLGSGSLLVAKTDVEVLNECMDYLESIQKDIDRDIETKGVDNSWSKKWPSKYGSPCLRRKFDAIDQVCPYIRKCWPLYSEALGSELDEFLL